MDSICIQAGEYWWGGSTNSGISQPFSRDSVYEADFRRSASNQTMPLLLSSQGRYIWSESPFAIKIADGNIYIEGSEIVVAQCGNTLREAYLGAMRAHFPFSDQKLPGKFFAVPQYNTWMQFTYTPTQEGVLRYAHAVLDNGFPAGILIIDEGWHGKYGLWQFDRAKFPDPRAMVDELHRLGFTVMLWVTPYTATDGKELIEQIFPQYNQEAEKYLLRNAAGDPALMLWWNGYSFMHNLTNPYDKALLDHRLHALMEEYGIDGFKFDGGSLEGYTARMMVNGPPKAGYDPVALNIAWNDFGARYAFHEYKDTFKGGGKAVIQRLRDRDHAWDGGNGLDSILPSALVAGLIGHPYICPDMIGGGEWTIREKYSDRFDPELFVRMAQASALFPMMQFSWAPWDDLDAQDLAIVREAAALHTALSPEILALVEHARLTGEPIMRPLEYEYPNEGYARITDQFLLGRDILVAPVIQKSATSRTVILPAGRWQSQTDGTVYESGTHIVPAPRSALPWFRRT